MSSWINVVEAGYDLALKPREWLENVLKMALPLMDQGAGVNAQLFQVSATQFSFLDFVMHGSETPEDLQNFLENAPQPVIDLVYRRGLPVGSLSEWLFPNIPGARDYYIQNVPSDFQDSFGLVAHTGTGMGLVLAAPLWRPRQMPRHVRECWSRVAAHLGAGLRLRNRFATGHIESNCVEAILSPDGHVEHAQLPAQSRSAREYLREAVRQCERARSLAFRKDSDAALTIWEGLVTGRWSLIDHFDTDRRRYVVAIRNDPDVPDPRGLSRRERQVAEFFGMGRPPKEIAYILGLSPSTIANTLTQVQAKLGMASKAELAAFFSPSGIRARLQEIELAGEPIAIGIQPISDGDKFSSLTETERELVLDLLLGATYAEIAARRGTSTRTVANQVQSIYRKTGVGSRLELARFAEES